MDTEWKRSGQIPAFGDWDYANDLPITQYFECARQAGLIRYSSSSGESDPYILGDLYAVDYKKNSRNVAPPRKARVCEKRGPRVKEQKKQGKQGKVCDVTEPPRKQQSLHNSLSHNHKLRDNDVVSLPNSRPQLPVRAPKPVDEDLYKIPPELLHSTKRKKMPGFFSCLVPPCA